MDKPITAKRRKELAKKVGISDPYLYQCITGRKDMNPAEARRVEEETKKELRREVLCQNTWAGIWPELVRRAKAKPEVSA